jgi:tartrate dehydrogenase/decarboxylase/D-malate dehydrogenase
MKTYRIATIPGDGIGKEVVPAGAQVLEALAKTTRSFAFEFENFDWGGDYYREHGVMMPADGLDAIRDKDAILFGSAGDPDIPDHITLWGLAPEDLPGLRPVRQRASDPHPAGHRWTAQALQARGPELGHRARKLGRRIFRRRRPRAPGPSDRSRDRRVDHDARRRRADHALRVPLAQSRPRKLLTVITKSNAQRHAMVMWDEIALQVSKEFPDVKWDKELVDASTARMVNRPATLDTIVATNLHADILSDLAAALAGSLGIAPTGNIDPERRYPSMFEPIHGSAFDIMGKGLANPVGTFWSVVMLLEHLGEFDAAKRVMQAVEAGHGGAKVAAYARPRRHGDDRSRSGRERRRLPISTTKLPSASNGATTPGVFAATCA